MRAWRWLRWRWQTTRREHRGCAACVLAHAPPLGGWCHPARLVSMVAAAVRAWWRRLGDAAAVPAAASLAVHLQQCTCGSNRVRGSEEESNREVGHARAHARTCRSKDTEVGERARRACRVRESWQQWRGLIWWHAPEPSHASHASEILVRIRASLERAWNAARCDGSARRP